MYAIDHCEMTREIKSSMDSADFTEAVVQRAGEIIQAALGSTSQESKSTGSPHKFPGVELVAQVMAFNVMGTGAARVASDMGVDLDRITALASSTHISSC